MNVRRKWIVLAFLLASFMSVGIELSNALNDSHVMLDHSAPSIYPPNAVNSPLHRDLSLQFDGKDLVGVNQDAFKARLTGDNITIAVFDTGIDPNHEVFTEEGSQSWTDKITSFYDEELDKTTSSPRDIQWHGTWTSSIIAGNSSAYQGVAPRAKLAIFKVFYYQDDVLTSTTSDLEHAIDWLIAHNDMLNVRIVSMSFGADPGENSEEDLALLHHAVEKLADAGILVVASAGNYGPEDGSITSPASSRSVLAVGGVDLSGKMYSKSGTGPTFEGITKPDLCAPAISIEGAEANTFSGYIRQSGTSAATPLVAGLAALLLEKDPSLTWSELKSILMMSSHRTIDPTLINDNEQGWGIIQGDAAIEALDGSLSLNSDLDIQFELNSEKSVKCIPLLLEPGHHFFELSALDASLSRSADLFLFRGTPDDFGNPIIESHSMSGVELNANRATAGVFALNQQQVYLVVKSRGSLETPINYTLKAYLEIRLSIIVLLGSLNVLSVILILKTFIIVKNKKG